MNNHRPHDGAATLDDVGNPYLSAAAPAAAVPDLDAAAPSLRTTEQQRVNRKALVFLGGIIGLLSLLAFLVFSNAMHRKAPERTSDEQVSVPSLGDSAPQLPPTPRAQPASAEPIELAPMGDASLSPPLPPPSPANEPASYPAYPVAPAPASPRPLSLLERRMGVNESGNRTAMSDGIAGATLPDGTSEDAYIRQQMAQMGLAAPSPEAQAADRRPKATSAQFLRHPDALLVRGTYLRCVLESRIVTDVPGYTSCVLTEPVYSINGRSLLLPRGSKIYGSYDSGPKGDRIEVVWDRITTPTGIDVSMASPGIDNLGGAGHPGERNSHWGSRISSALFVSLLSDLFKYEAAEHGPTTTTVGEGFAVQSPFESNTARTLDRLANQAVQQAMSRPPMVTINQGEVVTVYVARDVDFSQVLGG